MTVRKLQTFTLTEEIFREINSLVTAIIKTVLSRNFYHKSVVRVIFCNFHTIKTCIRKKFVKSIDFTEKYIQITMYFLVLETLISISNTMKFEFDDFTFEKLKLYKT